MAHIPEQAASTVASRARICRLCPASLTCSVMSAMGSPMMASSRSPLLAPGSWCPATGAYSRQRLLPAVWHTNSSTSSWCGARPATDRRPHITCHVCYRGFQRQGESNGSHILLPCQLWLTVHRNARSGMCTAADRSPGAYDALRIVRSSIWRKDRLRIRPHPEHVPRGLHSSPSGRDPPHRIMLQFWKSHLGRPWGSNRRCSPPSSQGGAPEMHRGARSRPRTAAVGAPTRRHRAWAAVQHRGEYN